MASFELAAAEGADGVELDVRLDGSREVVVLHDRTLARVSNAIETRDVESLRTPELHQVDLGRGERVPSLAQVLAWAARRGQRLNVELKSDVSCPHLLVGRVAALVLGMGASRSLVLLSSFHLGLLFSLRNCLPNVMLGWLVHEEALWRRFASSGRPRGVWAVHAAQSWLRPELVDYCHSRRIGVNAWTVNEPTRALELADWGADALITDDPLTVLAALSGHY